ncbi:hypothetical protein PQX77_021601 [Marasmius sp. AFHP31]|nr:hypothetical protein PQX77_021601 [Marasmius sp. AFHP31]
MNKTDRGKLEARRDEEHCLAMMEWWSGAVDNDNDNENPEEEDDEEGENSQPKRGKSSQKAKEGQTEEELAAKRRCQVALGRVVQPLLDRLSKYTGYSISFMAGEVKNTNDMKFNGYMLCAHPKGATPFALFNEAEFQQAGIAFGKWLCHVKAMTDTAGKDTSDVTPNPASTAPATELIPADEATQAPEATSSSQPPKETTSNLKTATNRTEKTRRKPGKQKQSDTRKSKTQGVSTHRTGERDDGGSESSGEDTDWSNLDGEEPNEKPVHDSDESDNVDINISDAEYARLSYEGQRRVNIARNRAKLDELLKDVPEEMLRGKRKSKAEVEREERRKRRKESFEKAVEQRQGKPRCSARQKAAVTASETPMEQPPATISAASEVSPNVQPASNQPRDLNPLYWPEVYTMACEYVNNGDDENFTQFEGRLSDLFTEVGGISYEYRHLRELFEAMWVGETDSQLILSNIESIRSKYCDGVLDGVFSNDAVNPELSDGMKTPQETKRSISPFSNVGLPPSSSPPSPLPSSPHRRATEPSSPPHAGPDTAEMDSNAEPTGLDSIVGTEQTRGHLAESEHNPSPDASHPRPDPVSQTNTHLDLNSQPIEDGNVIPMLPSYMKYGPENLDPDAQVDHSTYAEHHSRLKFPENYLLYLQTVPKDCRERPEEFMTAVMKWIKLENVWLSKDQTTQGFDKEKRPVAFTRWFREGRTRSLKTPKYIQHQQMEAEWWPWWLAVNPSWRTRNEGRVVEGGDGEWDMLMTPGKDGVVLFLVALHWWFDALGPDDNSEGWRQAMAIYYTTLYLFALPVLDVTEVLLQKDLVIDVTLAFGVAQQDILQCNAHSFVANIADGLHLATITLGAQNDEESRNQIVLDHFLLQTITLGMTLTSMPLVTPLESLMEIIERGRSTIGRG